MSENLSPENIESIAKGVAEGAAEGLSLKKLTEPTMQELGQTLGTIFGLANVLLFPLDIVVQLSKAKKEAIIKCVTDRISAIPEGRRKTPNKRVALEAISGAIYSEDADNSDLRDVYLRLLASTVDTEMETFIHPAFPDIIKQLTPIEAEVMSYFAEAVELPLLDVLVTVIDKEYSMHGGYREANMQILENFGLAKALPKELSVSRLNALYQNLIRLELIEIRYIESIKKEDYHLLEGDSIVHEKIQLLKAGGERIIAVLKNRKMATLTDFGLMFCKACICEPEQRDSIKLSKYENNTSEYVKAVDLDQVEKVAERVASVHDLRNAENAKKVAEKVATSHEQQALTNLKASLRTAMRNR